MTSLRKSEGIALDCLDTAEKERLLKISEKYRATGMLRIDEGSIRLTLEGKLFADRIAADLFK
jgi:coproporphyrinogen III oxidase-like Fe-S oxidoreductase